MAVKTARRHPAKIADARQSRFNKALEKFIHPLATQRHLRADRLVFAQFEIRNAFLGPCFDRALAGDQSQFRLCLLQCLFHVRLRADRRVNHHLLHLRHLMNVLVAVLFLQRRHHAVFVIAVKFVVHLRHFLLRLFRELFLFPLLSLGLAFNQFHIRNVDRPFPFRDLAARIVL